MKKACGRCGRIHEYSFICDANKTRRDYSDTEENRLRSKSAWKKKRSEIRDLSYYLCEVCKDKGDYTPKEVEVHHINKLRENKDLFLENGNLITLCRFHHKEADRGYLEKSYLLELVKKRETDLDDDGIPPEGS